MFQAGLDFSLRSLMLALRMTRYVWAPVALIFLLMSLMQGQDSINPIIMAVLIVLFPILFSMQVCLGFSLYHGTSPFQAAFVEHAVKHAPAVIITVFAVAICFALGSLVPLFILTLLLPPEGLFLLLLPAAMLAQFFAYISMARLVDTGQGIVKALTSSLDFTRQNWQVLLPASIFVILLPTGIDFASDYFAGQIANGSPDVEIIWRYLVQAPITALTTSISCAAGVIAVTEGNWQALNRSS